jgi:hypothetical protein
MRDFRDAKAIARALRMPIDTTHTEALELIAKAFGYNTSCPLLHSPFRPPAESDGIVNPQLPHGEAFLPGLIAAKGFSIQRVTESVLHRLPPLRR